jgi:hypothetical protein
LPLYHGAYSQLLTAIDRRLGVLPGLYLEANYKGGVSVRDRIRCADLAATRILRHRERMSRKRPSSRISGGAQNIVPVSATVR